MNSSEEYPPLLQVLQDLQSQLRGLEERERTKTLDVDASADQESIRVHQGIQLKLAELAEQLSRVNIREDLSRSKPLGCRPGDAAGNEDKRSDVCALGPGSPSSSSASEDGGWVTPNASPPLCGSEWITPNESFTFSAYECLDGEGGEEMKSLDDRLKAQMIELIRQLKRPV